MTPAALPDPAPKPAPAAGPGPGDKPGPADRPGPGGGPLLELRDLVKYFPLRRGIVVKREIGRVHAVDGVSLAVRRGETLGLVGETGCGKSTLARCADRLYPVTSGQVLFDGQDITALGRRQVRPYRRRIQMIFQDPYGSLNPRRRVGSIIGDPFAIHGTAAGAQRKRAVQELMELVGLNPEHYNRFPSEFSGGQRQRIGVARAVALRPELVIADEPVSALDVSIQAQIINLLADLQGEFGLTYLFITHDLSVVRHVSDRIAVMYLGQVVELAATGDLHQRPRHPYTNALLSAASVADPDRSAQRRRIVLAGDVPSPVTPPDGCRFHPRCPKAQQRCTVQAPVLLAQAGDPDTHLTACHFPVQPGEDLTAAGTGLIPPQRQP
ncbi:oligopeptide/dipeptide ABC transporter ATP-binding protein [Streptacidiphilus sp. MAP12-16]|uniref:ABC transporter ATP-binding protein n=1 Tax=Streptacidiphilus sp. MAP12-16 TaxID=3156300 RepID=UPI0035144256